MSFIEELKRRNVFKVGIAYAVGAWLLLQLTEVLSELLTLPSSIGPIVVTGVAIGFPIVIFVAWAFEMTPEGIKKEAEVDRSQSVTTNTGKKLNVAIVVMLSLAVAYLLYDKFAVRNAAPPNIASSGVETGSESVQSETDTGNEESGTSVNPRSIAVLPFTNRSRNEDDAFFVEGMHDDLLTNLARIGDLKVISRTSVLRFKDTEKPIPEIAQELGVATVMEGAVQRAGNTVRINVQLIDAATDEHLWAEIFDREMTAENLFAIQSEISQQIAEALEATLSPEEQQLISDRPTENLEAYNAYLRGRQQMALRTSANVEAADDEFYKAVELDPEFALAWAAIAENARWMLGHSTMSLPDSIRVREEAALKALELNPELGMAYLPLATVDEFHERWDEAETKYLKAIELSPGLADAYDWYSDFLASFPARRREALAMARKAEELDPLSESIRVEVAEQLFLLGQIDAAEEQLRRMIQLNPENKPAIELMANVMSFSGRYDEQIRWLYRALEIDPGDINLYVALAFAYLDVGDVEALVSLKDKVADIDAEHWSNGWLDTLEDLESRNLDGALESGRWVQTQLGNLPDFHNFFGWVHLLNRDYEKARESFEIAHVEYFDRTTWRAGLERNPSNGCFMPYILSLTGDEQMASDLLQLTISYLEFEYPNYVAHADRAFLESCYLLSGQPEKAIAAFETTVDHGHYSQWWIWLDLPIFDDIKSDPRFAALIEDIHKRAAIQRANLAQMELSGP